MWTLKKKYPIDLIYKKMNDEINGKPLDFLDTVNERAEKFPISMGEITKEVEEVRSTNYLCNIDVQICQGRY